MAALADTISASHCNGGAVNLGSIFGAKSFILNDQNISFAAVRFFLRYKAIENIVHQCGLLNTTTTTFLEKNGLPFAQTMQD
uniref:Uncharacterized protein n=1 Tax=Romanomermis culicivorax TaxID=13658 RepID=A0A915KN79_ROMCU